MSVQTSKKQSTVSIYWDYQNVPKQDQANPIIDFAKSKGNLIIKKVYSNLDFEKPTTKTFFQSINFTCVNVPCTLRNSVDDRLISNLISDINIPNQPSDIVIIVSGDGDFRDLVELLKRIGKHVVVLAQKGNVKQLLKEQAHEFYFIDELPKIGQKEVESKSQIDYQQAVTYLTTAIKTALAKGKAAALGYINKLMLELFPNYQGVSCIRTLDGKQFTKFAQFVDTVVKDGKVKRQNQSLLLIE